MNEQNLNEFIKIVVSYSFDANKYFNDAEPWALKEKNPERMKVIIFTVSLSGSIGLIFGVLPARRASKLDPIVALRSL